jgi:hypothetical protein
MSATSGLEPADKFVTLLSAAAHDVGHRGVNNNFLITARDDLALTYNDLHVQENMHAAEAARVIRDSPGCDVFELCEGATAATLRKTMIDLILGTDLADHFSHVADFRAKAEAGKMQHGDKILAAILCADIGHGAKPPPVHSQWSARVAAEFYAQGDRERAAGESVSALCDREEGDESYRKAQTGFLTFLVRPLFAVAKEQLGGGLGELLMANIALNIESYGVGGGGGGGGE